ncbi:MAG: hypothetical protein LBV04_03395 [Deferribacteraceae bacterium]|nr:hypothetical protein [Deferribacteraceae bacterium]
MRLLCILAICIFASVNLFAADLLPLTEDGFGGIKWGAEYSKELAQKNGLVQCLDIGDIVSCVKENEQLKELAGAPIKVVYDFKYGNFTGASITFNAHQWPAIAGELTKVYGKSTNKYGGVGHSNSFRYSNNIYGADVNGFYDELDNQRIYISKDIIKRNTDRFDRMALSTFTADERKSLEGFLGLKWGMTVVEIPHKLVLVKDDVEKEEKKYIQSDNLYFGSIPVEHIEYTFKNNRLVSMWIYSNPPRYWLHSDLLSIFVDIIELNFGKMEILESTYFLNFPKTEIFIYEYRGINISAHVKSNV